MLMQKCESCCENVVPTFILEQQIKIGVCSGCGGLGGGDNTPFTASPSEDSCFKFGSFFRSWNVKPITQLIYSQYKSIYNYGLRLVDTANCFGPSVNYVGHPYLITHECNYESCDPCSPRNHTDDNFFPPFLAGEYCCNTTVTPSGREDGCCSTGFGLPRVSTMANPVNDCELDFGEWSEPQPASNLNLHRVSTYGNNRTKIISRIRVKDHSPTTSCYLKLWFRKKITTRYIIGKEGAFGEILGDPIITYEDLSYTYEWTGSGNPCFEFEDKIFSHPDNKIINPDDFSEEIETEFTIKEEALEEFTEWSASVNEAANTPLGLTAANSWGSNLPRITTEPPFLGGLTTAQLETKYSIVQGYEPPW